MSKLINISTICLVTFISSLFANTLEDIKDRGYLKCGISTGLPGFAQLSQTGQWEGFDVTFCKATAAAIFDDPNKVEFVPLTSKVRFTALQSKEIDLLYRNTTWTATRHLGLGLTFAGINFYDGQGFMVPKDLGITKTTELDGASICVATGTTTEMNLADHFSSRGMAYNPIVFESQKQVRQAYEAGRCDAITTDRSGLAAHRSVLKSPESHMVLAEVISKEPLGPVVRAGDEDFAKLVSYVLYGLIAAEELGVNSNNIDQHMTSDNPKIQRLLGTVEMPYGYVGLDSHYIYRAVKHVGNYGEIYDRHIGPSTPIALDRGINGQWTNGGIMYAPPFR